MNDHDDVLERTLRSLERSLPVTSHDRGRPSQHRRPRRSRWTSPIVAAVALVALAGGATGSAVVSEVVRGHPGLFAPGGILYCTRIKDMTPREADAVLTELGYDVTWQVEDRTAGTSTQTTTAPEDGYVIEGVVNGRALLLVVESGEGAVPVPSGCGPAAA